MVELQILFHTFQSHYPCVDVSLSSFAAERRRDEDTWSQSNAVGSLTDPVLATVLQPLYTSPHSFPLGCGAKNLHSCLLYILDILCRVSIHV